MPTELFAETESNPKFIWNFKVFYSQNSLGKKREQSSPPLLTILHTAAKVISMKHILLFYTEASMHYNLIQNKT